MLRNTAGRSLMPGRSMIMTHVTFYFDGFNLHSCTVITLDDELGTWPWMLRSSLVLKKHDNGTLRAAAQCYFEFLDVLHNIISPTFPLLNHTYVFRVKHCISYDPIIILKFWRYKLPIHCYSSSALMGIIHSSLFTAIIFQCNIVMHHIMIIWSTMDNLCNSGPIRL